MATVITSIVWAKNEYLHIPKTLKKTMPNLQYLFLLLATCFAISTASQAQSSNGTIPLMDFNISKEYEIGGISVSGTQFLDNNVLVSISGLSVGDRITLPGEKVADAIKNLWEQGLFSDIQILATKIVNDVAFIEIKLVERPRLSKYGFEGLRKAEEEDLRDKLNLTRGRIVNENLLSITRNTVSDFFRKKGFWNATVDIDQKPDTLFGSNSIAIDIAVRRGNKVRIDNISFTGNDNALSRSLKKPMKETKERLKFHRGIVGKVAKDLAHTNIPDLLGNITIGETMQYIDDNVMRFKLFSTSKFLEEEYEKDKLAIVEHYNDLGFRDARIVQDTFYLNKQGNMEVNIEVDEGQQYYFRNIEWRGNNKYDDELLSRILGIKKGDIYSQATLRSRLFMDASGSDVTSLYMDDGYLFFNVNPEERTVEGDSIDLVININEGAQATVDKIIIKGNDKTNEHVIRREIRSLPGSKFSRADIIRSQREIAALNFFDPEQIQINPIPNPEKGTVDIEYKLAEKSSDQLELSAGWGGTTVVGSIGVAFNNFSLRNIGNKQAWRPLPSGDGQRLSLRFQSTGKAYQSLSASFSEPWLGGKKPNSLTTTLYSTRQATLSGVSELYTIGASVELGRRLRFPDDNFVLRNSIDYQYYNLKKWTGFVITDGVSNNLSTTVTLARYSLDQPLFPRSGSNIVLSLQITPPYSLLSGKDYSDATNAEKYRWAEYHKWKLKAEWFTPIVGKLILRTAAKIGMMGYYNKDIGYSPFQRFEVGGDGIGNFNLVGKDIIALRGYDQGNITGRNNNNSGHPFYAKYTVELRYPLSLNPNSTIYAQAFAEGGNSWASFDEFNPFDVQRSAGIGLRIFLPMFGMLGFDYGIGFDKTTAESSSFGNYLSNKARFSVVLGQEPE
jgi:outer membrane protein insertion porin family